jgi:hypothetical protein
VGCIMWSRIWKDPPWEAGSGLDLHLPCACEDLVGIRTRAHWDLVGIRTCRVVVTQEESPLGSSWDPHLPCGRYPGGEPIGI